MRVLIQRVASAEVRVGGASVGAIGRGILALVGVGAGDTAADAEYVARKLLSLRIFEDDKGRPWSGSVATLGLGLLLVSQFTLHASCRKTKPSFQRALGGAEARPLFDQVVRLCRAEKGVGDVATGEFGAMMDVSLVNSGPVTLWLDSKNPHDAVWGSVGGGGNGSGGGGGGGDDDGDGGEGGAGGAASAAGGAGASRPQNE